MITLDLLKQFVSEDETRPNIMGPWVADGFTYATDGRILLRIAGVHPEVFPNPGAPSIPALLKVMPPYPAQFEAEVPATIEAGEFIPCEVCKGDGKHYCVKCCTYHHCGKCEGDGGDYKYVGVTIGNRKISSKYLALIAKLPNPRMCVAEGKPGDPAWFAFDGGDGLVMPMKPEAEKD